MIELDIENSIAFLKLDRGMTNALNLEMIHELADIIEKVEDAPEARALVLSSANEKFFSIGFDIPQLFDLPKDDFHEFFRAFNQTCMALYTMPKPTVAGITGHAIAGGCILALCCDYRVIGEGRKLMGLNEIKLGVPVPYLAECILQSITGNRVARDVVESGEFFTSEVLLQQGFVDEIAPQAKVVTHAMAKAALLAQMPPEAYRRIKENRTEQVEVRIRAKWEERQQAFIELWYSEDARKRLWEAMKKF